MPKGYPEADRRPYLGNSFEIRVDGTAAPAGSPLGSGARVQGVNAALRNMVTFSKQTYLRGRIHVDRIGCKAGNPAVRLSVPCAVRFCAGPNRTNHRIGNRSV